jgi:hypothetical protein
MPEWAYLVVALAVAGLAGLLWTPLFLALPLAAVTALASIVLAAGSSAGVIRATGRSVRSEPRRWLWLTGLVLLQVVARLRGRLSAGLTPWRVRGSGRMAVPRRREVQAWSESWRSLDARLRELEASLGAAGVAVRRGDAFDRWDLEVRSAALGSARLHATVEEHGHGRQLVRWRIRPRISRVAVGLVAAAAALTLLAARAGAVAGAALLFVVAVVVAAWAAMAAGRSVGLVGEVLRAAPATQEAVTTAETA